VRNDETATGWRQVLRRLKAQRSRQKQDQQAQRTAHLASKAQIYAQKQQEKMIAYLQSGDPILVQEALQWLAQQDEVSLEALLPANHRQSVSTAVRMREQQRLTGTLRQAEGRSGQSMGMAYSRYPG
jgi:mevalonate kinase